MFGIRFNTTPGQFVLPQGTATARAFDDSECITNYVACKLLDADADRSLQALREEEAGLPTE